MALAAVSVDRTATAITAIATDTTCATCAFRLALLDRYDARASSFGFASHTPPICESQSLESWGPDSAMTRKSSCVITRPFARTLSNLGCQLSLPFLEKSWLAYRPRCCALPRGRRLTVEPLLAELDGNRSSPTRREMAISTDDGPMHPSWHPPRSNMWPPDLAQGMVWPRPG